MFNSGYEFNQKGFFLHFNGLLDNNVKNLIGKSKTNNENQDFDHFKYFHDEFVYKAYFSYSILGRMKALKENAFKPQFDALRPFLHLKEESEILYSSFLTREYLYYLMPFLNTLFILQDRIMIILGKYLGIKAKLPKKLPSYYYDHKKKKKTPHY